jgi:hypothetical protein
MDSFNTDNSSKTTPSGFKKSNLDLWVESRKPYKRFSVYTNKHFNRTTVVLRYRQEDRNMMVELDTRELAMFVGGWRKLVAYHMKRIRYTVRKTIENGS